MKTQIKVEAIETKVGKESGKSFKVVKTDQGNMSCWSTPILKQLDAFVGTDAVVEVEMVEEKGYKTIRQFYGAAEQPKVTQENMVPQETKESRRAEAVESREVRDYTSYAKDIFCTLVRYEKHDDKQIASLEVEYTKRLMQLSVELVKQAKEEFEK